MVLRGSHLNWSRWNKMINYIYGHRRDRVGIGWFSSWEEYSKVLRETWALTSKSVPSSQPCGVLPCWTAAGDRWVVIRYYSLDSPCVEGRKWEVEKKWFFFFFFAELRCLNVPIILLAEQLEWVPYCLSLASCLSPRWLLQVFFDLDSSYHVGMTKNELLLQLHQSKYSSKIIPIHYRAIWCWKRFIKL